VAFGDVIDQRHLFATEQLFDIDENQHTLAERAKTGEILGRQRYREFRRRADLFGGKRQHVGDAVANLRGVIVPIIDLRVKFAQQGVSYDENTVVIVLKSGVLAIRVTWS
jgi:hypothetical protein